MRVVMSILIFASLSACEPVPDTPEQAAVICEDRARAAQGPTGRVTVGTTTGSGGFGGVEVGLSSDFLTGRDPVEVYNECVFDRTGMSPIRPPVLR